MDGFSFGREQPVAELPKLQIEQGPEIDAFGVLVVLNLRAHDPRYDERRGFLGQEVGANAPGFLSAANDVHEERPHSA